MEQPKFKVGQHVKFHQDNDGEAGQVVSFSFDPQNGYTYQISARELDIPNKQVIEGIKHCRENELTAIDSVAPEAPAPGIQITPNVASEHESGEGIEG